ncbi:hypothetical protein NDU88_003145 [Pleurodeles waltl]|uniref:Uncharacterized protein n=1 Tax=Pleurodeles waltl TaxID=8319 RepID=A0AAV7T3U6_PLEWA|nr:hypothetical protein NDU88_003145 [Pleurodeles waltl]
MAQSSAAREQAQHNTTEAAPSSNINLKQLILEGYMAITEKINRIAITVALLKQDMEKIQEQTQDSKYRVGTFEDLVAEHTGQLTGLRVRLKLHEEKMAN